MIDILYIKAIHIVSVVSWFSGLFYLVRLFIYHTEANERPEPEKGILLKEYERNERLLWRAITQPAMLLTLATGVTMLYIIPGYLTQPWMWVKLCLVIILLLYHFSCRYLHNQLKKKQFAFSSYQLRLYNEIATVLLVAIVFLVVLKSTMNMVTGLIGFVLFAIILMVAVKLVKKLRRK